MPSTRASVSPAPKKGNGAAVGGVDNKSKDERGRARRREEEEEREAAARRQRARGQGPELTRREKAAEGVKNTAKAISEGWSNINWGGLTGLAARARTSGGNTWTAVRSKVGAVLPKDKAAAAGGRTRRKKKGGGGLGKIGNRSKMPKRSPREQLLEQQEQKRTGLPSSSSSSSSGSNNKGFFLPSLLQRIDPSAYTASMWNQMMTPGQRGREGGREGTNNLLRPPPTERPRAFDELVKFPAGPAEAWDLFVDDTRHFFDSVYKLMAPTSALPKPGPSRPQVGGVRPKAERVKKGPLYAAPLVLRQKMGSALAPWWPPELQQQQEQEQQGEEGVGTVMDDREEEEEEEEVEEEVEDEWQDLRGRVKNMIEETSDAPSGAEYYALSEKEEEEGSWEGKGKEEGRRASRGTSSKQQQSSQKNLPVPLQAPRLVDRLDERPRGIISSAATGTLSTSAAAAVAAVAAAAAAVSAGGGMGSRGTMDAWVPLPPFPSQPPMEDEYWPVPSSSSSSSPAYRASSAFDDEEEEWDDDDEEWEEEEEEEEVGEEGGLDSGVIAPWRRGLPEWLQRVSLTRLLVRKPTPERMMEIIRRRQQVRRMPRKMDDVFLRTVSRKLQGNRMKIREFQLQTDRYRNSLLSAQAYVDAVVLLFGTSKHAEEVLLPLTRWLPEASKRTGLAEEYKARRRARLGLLVGGGGGRGGGKVGGGGSKGKENAGTMAMVGEVRKAAVAATTAWLSRVGMAVSGWFAGGVRGAGELGRGLAKVLNSNSTLIELSFETGEEEDEESGGAEGREVWREGEDVNPALRALAGFEKELERRGQAASWGDDEPMARIVDILGDKNADYFQQRLDLYLRGGLPGMDLYRALKRLCLENEMRLDLVMRQLREESLREDQKWKSKNEKLAALLRIHESQRKITW